MEWEVIRFDETESYLCGRINDIYTFFRQILISIKEGERSEILQLCNQSAELITEFRVLSF